MAFAESPLRLNAGLGQQTEWSEATIIDRADRLADIAVNVWASPKLPDDVLATYRPTTQPAAAGHTIAEHPHLLRPPMDAVFQALRTEVLALDPVVAEEFMKLYVAYKAETNFVDVVPQAKRLVLTLNMAYSDIVDPRGLCRDVTGLGRWGNGDAEVSLTTIEDVPYVMGLVRQSLQQQLGNEDSSA